MNDVGRNDVTDSVNADLMRLICIDFLWILYYSDCIDLNLTVILIGSLVLAFKN